MNEDDSTHSWSLLAPELLDKIFSYILPRHLLSNVGLVCESWHNAVHYKAVKYLASCIENHLIEERELERWGWRSADAWDHSSLDCSCIRLAFSFFIKQKKPCLVQAVLWILIHLSPTSLFRLYQVSDTDPHLTVLWIRTLMDPHSFGCPGSGSFFCEGGSRSRSWSLEIQN